MYFSFFFSEPTITFIKAVLPYFISVGLPEEFGSVAKKGVGWIFSLICPSIIYYMETKVDTVYTHVVDFALNSVFLIGPKMTIFFFLDLIPIFLLFFSPPHPLPFASSSPLLFTTYF